MIVIIGAGIFGLTAAANLPPSKEYIVLEKENYCGGLSTQYFADGHWFDYGGHYFHFQDKEEIKDYLFKFCKFKNFIRKSKTFLLDRYIPFPVQFHLSHLPAPLKNKIFKEIMAAGQGRTDNLRDFLADHFGDTLFQLFFEPFMSKYYQVDLTALAAGMERGSIPVPDRKQVIGGFKGNTYSKTGYNPFFYSPASSLRYFFGKYTQNIVQNIKLNQKVVKIDLSKRKVITHDNSYPYEKLISTMPLNRLLEIITPQPQGQFPSPRDLRHISTLVINVVLKKKRKRFHWVYLPEQKFPFYRLGFYSVHPLPVCYLERTVSPDYAVNRDELFQDINFTLKELKIIHHSDEIEYFNSRLIPISYVLFTRNWQTTVPPLMDKLKEYNIYSGGRYGAWNYTSMSDNVQSALQLVSTI